MIVNYIILHYKNINDTINCVESLLKIINPNHKIVVVDNGSNDGSGEKLEENYCCYRQIKVLKLPKNVGFSKGNNAGYQYIKKELKSDFIVITNNDVIFYQDDFEGKIESIYLETKFHVLGPDVYIPRHKDHQNPLFKTPINIEELKNEINQYKYYKNYPNRFEERLKIHILKNMLCSNNKMINFLYSKFRKKEVLDYRKRYMNVGLQGSCLIFSKDFIDNENKAFDPEPFLYEEEVFLFLRCKKRNYKMLYDPSIGIIHAEAASFTHSTKNNKERITFMLEHHIKSREALLDYMSTR
ncbi:glycosyltransferase [Dubosiella newyorkensis]|uniref:glycosyltransferase n=1 Tax=Dubosiella newyorkensis TaxID=1862672 RepID=UPI0032B1EA2A